MLFHFSDWVCAFSAWFLNEPFSPSPLACQHVHSTLRIAKSRLPQSVANRRKETWQESHWKSHIGKHCWVSIGQVFHLILCSDVVCNCPEKLWWETNDMAWVRRAHWHMFTRFYNLLHRAATKMKLEMILVLWWLEGISWVVPTGSHWLLSPQLIVAPVGSGILRHSTAFYGILGHSKNSL